MKIKNVAKKYGAKIATGSALLVASASSFAELPAAIGTGITELQTDAGAMAELFWPAVVAVFGSLLLFTLFKRFGRKI